MSDALVRDSAARLFGDLATPEVVNAAEEGAWPAALWDAAAEAGFTEALATDETPAGLAGIDDGMTILRAAGRRAAPLPLAETMLAQWLFAGARLAAPKGPLAIAPVAREDGFTLRRNGAGWRLAGGASGVPWAARAAAIAVLADGHVARLEPGQATVRGGANLAGEPRDEITVDAVLASDAVAPAPAGVDAAVLYRLGALSRAVQMAGALDEVLALSVQYANDRVQFGRPIGKFQAIQQQLAILAEQVAAAGVAATTAVEAVARGGDLGFGAAVAKSRVGEAAGKATDIAHQVHGAIGFTHEHRLHHLTRRLWSWRDEFGVESEWSIELGRLAAARGAEGAWPLLTAW